MGLRVDVDAPSAVTTNRAVLGASVAGSGHVQRGLACQDAFRVGEQDDRLAIAVADGLGSAARSDVGARAACDAAVMRALELEHGVPTVVAATAVVAAREQLEAIASDERCDLSDLGCTLIVVVCEGDRVAIAHIGDGGVVGLAGENAYVLSPPGASEYLNEVDPLTSAAWIDHVRVVSCLRDVDAIVAFTDGCQHAALRTEGGVLRAHAGFIRPLVGFARGGVVPDEGNAALAELLGGPKISEHSDDDKTLVIAALR